MLEAKTKGSQEQKDQWTAATAKAMAALERAATEATDETQQDTPSDTSPDDDLDLSISSISSIAKTGKYLGPDELEGVVAELKEFIEEVQGQQDDVLQTLADNMTAIISPACTVVKKRQGKDNWISSQFEREFEEDRGECHQAKRMKMLHQV